MEVLCVIYAPLVSMLTGRTICTRAILVRLQRKKSMTIQRTAAILRRMRIPKNKNHHRNQRRLHQKRKLKVGPNIIFVK
ncbi:unnamed protein product [Nesidiocoris tenuis]|uniref:Uncharacterized protein n=1 Tax=Nesidiocoris tenuis TaxID=355587 RepID=A0A6H5GPD5_9HEMI|nr:unnamed protein product [Nesidiocoris tenuis]